MQSATLKVIWFISCMSAIKCYEFTHYIFINIFAFGDIRFRVFPHDSLKYWLCFKNYRTTYISFKLLHSFHWFGQYIWDFKFKPNSLKRFIQRQYPILCKMLKFKNASRISTIIRPYTTKTECVHWLPFVWRIQRGSVDSPYIRLVIRKTIPGHDVIFVRY